MLFAKLTSYKINLENITLWDKKKASKSLKINPHIIIISIWEFYPKYLFVHGFGF